jgi:hypothetical protein
MAKRIKKTNSEVKIAKPKAEKSVNSSKSVRSKKREKEITETPLKGKRKKSSAQASKKGKQEEKSTTKNRKKARARNTATEGKNNSFVLISCGIGVVLVIVVIVIMMSSDKKPARVEEPQTVQKTSKPSKKEIPLATRKAVYKEAVDNEDIALERALKKYPSPKIKVNDIKGRELRKKRNNEKIKEKRSLDSVIAKKYNISSKDVDKITDEGLLSGW